VLYEATSPTTANPDSAATLLASPTGSILFKIWFGLCVTSLGAWLWLPQLRGASTSIARTKIDSRCLVTIRYRPGKRCHPSQCVWYRNATWSTFSIIARRFLPLMTPLEKATRGPSLDPLGGGPTVGLARPCSRDRPYEGSVSPACLKTVAANRRFAKLYLSPIRAVPARSPVDARVGGSMPRARV
jgi:hypothetical protein